MKKLAFIFIALTGFCHYVQAQMNGNALPRDIFFVGYEIAIPTNNDYLTKTSWSGARFEYRRMILPNVSAGIATSFNSFEEYFPKTTYQKKDGTGAITSDMIRQVYTAPITASVHYYFEGKMIRPYAGIGLGAAYSEQNAYFNIYAVEESNWGFVARPEIGFLGKFAPNIGGFASIAYNYSTNSNSAFNIKHLSQFPITIGLIFTPQ